MGPKYDIGQEVVIRPAGNEAKSARDSNIVNYAGQTGTVTNYYWINPIMGEFFYVYTVQFGVNQKEIVLHEDEIATITVAARKKR